MGAWSMFHNRDGMRSLWITVPAGLAFASAGGALYILANAPHVESYDIGTGPVRHEVTSEMVSSADKQSQRVAPGFQVSDVEGKSVTIGSSIAQRPQFVYFVLDGCPCSFDAEPLFQQLGKRYKGKVDFVAVTNGNAAKARDWSVQMLVPYPVVADPNLEIIHAYKARSSVYSALITKDGRIAKMWPGYSRGILAEQNKLMAKMAGVKEVPFEAKFAPIKQAAGCSFAL